MLFLSSILQVCKKAFAKKAIIAFVKNAIIAFVKNAKIAFVKNGDIKFVLKKCQCKKTPFQKTALLKTPT